MVNELILFGSASAVVSIVTLGFAGVETVRLVDATENQSGIGNALKTVWGETVNEPVPGKFRELLNSLGGENGSNSKDTASS